MFNPCFGGHCAHPDSARQRALIQYLLAGDNLEFRFSITRVRGIGEK